MVPHLVMRVFCAGPLTFQRQSSALFSFQKTQQVTGDQAVSTSLYIRSALAPSPSLKFGSQIEPAAM